MSSIFLWLGLTFVVACPIVFPIINLGSAVEIFKLLGGLLMLIGSVLLLFRK